MMCLGDGIDRSMNFPSVRDAARYQSHVTLGTLHSHPTRKNRAVISTFLPIEAMRRAAQKFSELIDRHEPRAWCSDK